jgi:hypothetical protein
MHAEADGREMEVVKEDRQAIVDTLQAALQSRSKYLVCRTGSIFRLKLLLLLLPFPPFTLKKTV